MSNIMDDIKSTITTANSIGLDQQELGATSERMRIRWAIGTNADTILEYNEKIKSISDELVGEQSHTLRHITEMIEICSVAIKDAVKE